PPGAGFTARFLLPLARQPDPPDAGSARRGRRAGEGFLVSQPDNTGDGRLNVGVLGGGALGLSAAYRIAQSGARVTVLEKEAVVGGLAASFPVGGAHLEEFYHHLFRSYRVITYLIEA